MYCLAFVYIIFRLSHFLCHWANRLKQARSSVSKSSYAHTWCSWYNSWFFPGFQMLVPWPGACNACSHCQWNIPWLWAMYHQSWGENYTREMVFSAWLLCRHLYINTKKTVKYVMIYVIYCETFYFDGIYIYFVSWILCYLRFNVYFIALNWNLRLHKF